MISLSNKMFLQGATVLLLISIKLQSAEGLKCWTCRGFDQVEHQCSLDNDNGYSEQCSGSNPVCELVEEKHQEDGHVFYLRKCGEGNGSASTTGTCGPLKTEGGGVIKTQCYCNDKDDCNKGIISGRGDPEDDGGSSGAGAGLTAIVIVDVIFVLALVVGAGFGYRWYSGRSRRSGMEAPIPSDG